MSESAAQQFQRMGYIVTHVEKLDDANREWLMRRLAKVECRETAPGQAWTQPRMEITRPIDIKLDRKRIGRSGAWEASDG